MLQLLVVLVILKVLLKDASMRNVSVLSMKKQGVALNNYRWKWSVNNLFYFFAYYPPRLRGIVSFLFDYWPGSCSDLIVFKVGGIS